MTEINNMFCFGLINELYDFETDEEILLNNRLKLRKADEYEIKWFKKHLEHFSSDYLINYFEKEVLSSKDGLNPECKELKDDNWRYTVLEHDRHQLNLVDRLSLRLSTLNIRLIMEVAFEDDDDGCIVLTRDEYASFNNIKDSSQKYSKYGTKKFIRQKPNADIIKNFNDTNLKVNEFLDKKQEEYQFITKALNDLDNIDTISDSSSFKLISYFSIIESLITYPPRNSSDTFISKQLSRKIKLLYNSFLSGLRFNDYFKGADSNTIATIIEKLYNYRNDVAHGNIPGLNKELKIISDNKDCVIPFMECLLREILIVGISEPQLLLDIKEC